MRVSGEPTRVADHFDVATRAPKTRPRPAVLADALAYQAITLVHAKRLDEAEATARLDLSTCIERYGDDFHAARARCAARFFYSVTDTTAGQLSESLE